MVSKIIMSMSVFLFSYAVLLGLIWRREKNFRLYSVKMRVVLLCVALNLLIFLFGKWDAPGICGIALVIANIDLMTMKIPKELLLTEALVFIVTEDVWHQNTLIAVVICVCMFAIQKIFKKRIIANYDIFYLFFIFALKSPLSQIQTLAVFLILWGLIGVLLNGKTERIPLTPVILLSGLVDYAILV